MYSFLDEEYDVYYTGEPPAEVRIHQISMSRSHDFLAFNIYFGARQRMDVYVGDSYLLPINAKFSEVNTDNLLYIQPPRDNLNYFMTTFRQCNPYNGLHVYDLVTKILSLKMKGSEPVIIRQTEVSMLSIEVGVEMGGDFFAEEDLLLKLAAHYNIPLSSIRIVQAVNENDVRKRRDGSSTMTISLEFGDSPKKKVVQKPSQVTYDDGTSSSENSDKGILYNFEGKTDARASALPIIFLTRPLVLHFQDCITINK